MIHRDNAARAALALALGLCAGAAMPSPARAQDATPANRFFGGGSVDHMFGFDLSVDGKPVAEPVGKSKNGLFLLGIDRIVAHWLAVGVEGHIATWNTAWSDAAGYDSSRFLFDLDAVMRFRFPLVGLFPTSMTFSLVEDASVLTNSLKFRCWCGVAKNGSMSQRCVAPAIYSGVKMRLNGQFVALFFSVKRDKQTLAAARISSGSDLS